MDIHKPKPWHGVREFLKEYLIIVVGAQTALRRRRVLSVSTEIMGGPDKPGHDVI